MIDTEALKRLIIDKATSGLLSSRCDGDDDIESLIEKLPPVSSKREKLLAQSFDYDEKFIIPEHWKWVRLGEISSYGDTPAKFVPDAICDDMWILELEDIESGGRLLAKIRYPSRKPAGEKTGFTRGQILYSKLRPYLKKVLIADEDGVSTPELISFDVFGGIDAKYISYCLINSYVDRVINRRSYGVKMPRVDAGFMVNLPIPLPSIAEQKRIVSIVETAFFEIDRIAFLQQQYESDREILKGKIIDAGIRGKLTEQLPEDGNAEDLYARIQKEKAKLIKEGKIKKEKPLPEISEEEIPFEIPANWKWVRFLDAVRNISSRDHQITTSELSETGNYAAISQGMVFIDGYSNEEDKVIWNIPLVLFGDHTRNVKYIDFPFIVCADGTQLLQFIACDNKYFYYWTKSVVNQMSSRGYARHFSLLKKNIIPLPPLAEQTRIASRIEEMFALLEE